MYQLPTWYYNTEAFWIGASNLAGLFLLFVLTIANDRISALADDGSHEALLPHAACILVSATLCSCFETRETTQRLHGACFPSYRYYLAHRVRRSMLVCLEIH